MKYFFILGNNKTLSVAELSTLFGKGKHHVNEGIFFTERENELDSQNLIKRIGGTIKIGRIIDKSSKDKDEILEKLKTVIKPGEGKYKFGISYYGDKKYNAKALGMEIKKYLKEQAVSCRWVTSKEKNLSSVVVEQNKLITKGIEIVLIENNGRFFIGVTEAVQPFKELSKRDYGRPSRDDESGMLPPKLAQIMLNLARINTVDGPQKNKYIVDAFCGSGTIVTEAMLMGHKHIIGSDKSGKAVLDTKNNIEWIKNNFHLQELEYEIIRQDATMLSKAIKQNSVDVIVSEPFLGPQRGVLDLNKIVKELEELYSRTIKEFQKVLKPRGRVVMLFPVFFNKRKINPNLYRFKIVKPIREELRFKGINITERDTIIYGRQGQRVWREIVILELK